MCIDNKASVPHWVRDAGEALGDRVKHYILVSTVSVYTSNATPGHDETAERSTYDAGDPFAISAAHLRSNMRPIALPIGQCQGVAWKVEVTRGRTLHNTK